MNRVKSKVILAGAGPGDPELISLKGLKAIEWAEVILYDALVNIELLKHASPTCRFVFVGKRKGVREYAQDEINRLIVLYAYRYTRVLRLKGGDPFVFGRGHEELSFIKERGIEVEVIPGISSAIAAPASAGIPVTKRGVTESFWVITGMVSDGNFSRDLDLAAQSTATVVILMGMTHLKDIARLFANKRSEEEPVAIIQNATLAEQSILTGTAATIASLAEQHQVSSPAVIVFGKVVDEATIKQIIHADEVKLKVAV